MSTKPLLALLALIGITVAAYFYWPGAATAVSIRNETAAAVAVRLESDSGTIYPVSMIAAGATVSAALSGKDQQLRAIALYADGQSRASQQIRGDSREKWSIVIRNDVVEITHP